jgi:hypothetical protein
MRLRRRESCGFSWRKVRNISYVDMEITTVTSMPMCDAGDTTLHPRCRTSGVSLDVLSNRVEEHLHDARAEHRHSTSCLVIAANHQSFSSHHFRARFPRRQREVFIFICMYVHSNSHLASPASTLKRRDRTYPALHLVHLRTIPRPSSPIVSPFPSVSPGPQKRAPRKSRRPTECSTTTPSSID